jgi:hypothetical protein
MNYTAHEPTVTRKSRDPQEDLGTVAYCYSCGERLLEHEVDDYGYCPCKHNTRWELGKDGMGNEYRYCVECGGVVRGRVGSLHRSSDSVVEMSDQQREDMAQFLKGNSTPEAFGDVMRNKFEQHCTQPPATTEQGD